MCKEMTFLMWPTSKKLWYKMGTKSTWFKLPITIPIKTISKTWSTVLPSIRIISREITITTYPKQIPRIILRVESSRIAIINPYNKAIKFKTRFHINLSNIMCNLNTNLYKQTNQILYLNKKWFIKPTTLNQI